MVKFYASRQYFIIHYVATNIKKEYYKEKFCNYEK